ncbi:MAG: hypothetical protein ACK55Z_26270, partial [bacterium]
IVSHTRAETVTCACHRRHFDSSFFGKCFVLNNSGLVQERLFCFPQPMSTWRVTDRGPKNAEGQH